MEFTMTFRSLLLSSVVLTPLLETALGSDKPALAADNKVSTYKPMAGFNQIIGTTRFVGYFLQAPDLCRVTVFKARADDETLVSPPERVKVDIATGGRGELSADDGSALAIACTADAGAITTSPQHPTNVVTAP
jgi:hypothetical protein